MIFVFILYALFASVFTISKTGLAYSQPFFFVGSRMLLAGLCLLGYVIICDPEKFKIKKTHIWRVVQLAIFNIYLTNMCEFWGLQYLTSFKTCFIYSLSPFVSALLSFIIFSEKLSLKKWLGLIIGILGIMPVLITQTTQEELAGHFLVFSWAELSVTCAAICSVYGWILLKQLVYENGYSPLMVNGCSMMLGGTLSLIHSAFTESWDPIPVSDFVPFLGSTLLLILVSNLICYNLYGTLLKKFSATFMSFAGLTTPLFSALFGWLFLHEIISWPFYLSFIILGCGLFAFYQDELKPALADLKMPSPQQL